MRPCQVQKELDEKFKEMQQLEKRIKSAQEETRTLQNYSPQKAVVKKV